MNASAVPGNEREGRNIYIDMLRGVSILLVMLLHYSLSYHLQISPLQDWVSIPTLRAIFYNGNYGVDMFFVISGFLITSNILRRYGSLATVDVAHFYKLRFFRLYPLVVFALAVITVLGLIGLHNFSNIHRGENLGNGFFLIADLSVLTFWHNLLMEAVGYFNYAMNIYWSLSVEEVFYLLYPLLLVVARRRWQLVVLTGLCVIIAPIYRGIHRDNELFFMYGNVACMDMLTYGCVAAILAKSVKVTNALRRTLAVLTCLIGGWVYMRGINGNEALGASFLGIATALFLVAVSRLPADGVSRRLGRPLAWLGAHSYELYLFHIVVLGVIVELVPKTAMTIEQKLPMLAAFLALSAILAWLAARFFGDPLNRVLRSRFARGGAKMQDEAKALQADAASSNEYTHTC
ncbi:acyltransferase family protein [Dyella caseinilytica]|uniref:Acyltransferase n=1 Tax=Dyella caseinilytica TaxID=1849581 RepID=A0ABX7GTG4_9GAMM|nr:acyltransferase [Dyella caseinilytica]QRN53749.1 acyltransferase [Dyella caseinilytica]GFZ88864.1 acyltransferase [Dyella caseinilytica]